MSYYPNLIVAVQTNVSEGKKLWIMRVTRIYLIVSSPYKSNTNDPVSQFSFLLFLVMIFFFLPCHYQLVTLLSRSTTMHSIDHPSCSLRTILSEFGYNK